MSRSDYAGADAASRLAAVFGSAKRAGGADEESTGRTHRLAARFALAYSNQMAWATPDFFSYDLTCVFVACVKACDELYCTSLVWTVNHRVAYNNEFWCRVQQDAHQVVRKSSGVWPRLKKQKKSLLNVYRRKQRQRASDYSGYSALLQSLTMNSASLSMLGKRIIPLPVLPWLSASACSSGRLHLTLLSSSNV